MRYYEGHRSREAKLASCDYRYTVLFEPAEEGGYVVTCPALPGLVTEGDTLEHAREMATDAVRGYLESLTKDGIPPPRTIRSPSPPCRRRPSRSLSKGYDRSSGCKAAPADPRPGASRVRGSPRQRQPPLFAPSRKAGSFDHGAVPRSRFEARYSPIYSPTSRH